MNEEEREALVQQIAEAMHRSTCHVNTAPKFCSADGNLAWERWARAVLPLVEAQVAPLRDEVERLRREMADMDATHDRVLTITQRDKVAAESALRQVREDLALPIEEMDAGDDPLPYFAGRIQVILDSARVGAVGEDSTESTPFDADREAHPRQADTQPEGAGCCCDQLSARLVACPAHPTACGKVDTAPEVDDRCLSCHGDGTVRDGSTGPMGCPRCNGSGFEPAAPESGEGR